MKHINVPITVFTVKNRPHIIKWQHRRLKVQRIMEYWIVQGRWWHEEEKRVYLYLSTDQGPIEIFRRNTSEWILSRIFD